MFLVLIMIHMVAIVNSKFELDLRSFLPINYVTLLLFTELLLTPDSVTHTHTRACACTGTHRVLFVFLREASF